MPGDGATSVDGKDGQPDIAALILGLESRLSTQIEGVKTHLDGRINEIQQLATANQNAINKNLLEINKVTGIASTNTQDISNLQTDVNGLISDMQEANLQMKKELNTLHNTVSLQSIKLKVQRERTEDQTNRALRKTIVIRGIPEPTEENWSDTRTSVSNVLAKATKIHKDSISKVFERIHRGGKYNVGDQYPRKVHAVLFDWNDIAILRTALSTHGRKSGIYIDNHYGPDTTYRRSVAFKQRRSLMEEKTICAGYVAHPAKLFVKRVVTDKKYVLFKDFSNILVSLREEDLLNYEPPFNI